MRKELIILLQFLTITALVGYGYFGLLLLLRDLTMLSLWDEYEYVFRYWSLSFTALSFVRFALYYLNFREESHNLIQPKGRQWIGKELSRSIQYLMFAAVSVPISFYMIVYSNSAPHISLNINEMWRGVEEGYFGWLIGFFMLSLFRFGITTLETNVLRNKLIVKDTVSKPPIYGTINKTGHN